MPKEPKTDNGWLRYQIGIQENTLHALIVAVSEVTNDAPEEMEILYDVVDPRALCDLFEHSTASDHEPKLSFQYNGCQIVMSRGYVHVQEEDSS